MRPTRLRLQQTLAGSVAQAGGHGRQTVRVSGFREPIRLRRTLGTFLAWGGGSGAVSVFFLVFFGFIIIFGTGNIRLGVLLLAPLLAVAIVWLSGSTVIDGDELQTGSRLRPRIYRRHDFDAVSRTSIALGRWVTVGLALHPVSDGSVVKLRLSGGLEPARLDEWEQILWSWIAEGDAAVRPPIFALANDDPALMAFGSLTEAERYAEAWGVNDGLWTFWDSNGCLLSPPGRLDEGSGRTHLVSTGQLDVARLRVLLMDAMEVPVAEMSKFSQMGLVELAGVAAARITSD